MDDELECIRKEVVGCVVSHPLYLAVEFGKVHSKPWSAYRVHNSYGRGTSQVGGRSPIVTGRDSV